jgi:hypothetical protein
MPLSYLFFINYCVTSAFINITCIVLSIILSLWLVLGAPIDNDDMDSKGVFGSPSRLSHLIQAECSYAHYKQVPFIVMCLVGCMSWAKLSWEHVWYPVWLEPCYTTQKATGSLSTKQKSHRVLEHKTKKAIGSLEWPAWAPVPPLVRGAVTGERGGRPEPPPRSSTRRRRDGWSYCSSTRRQEVACSFSWSRRQEAARLLLRWRWTTSGEAALPAPAQGAGAATGAGHSADRRGEENRGRRERRIFAVRIGAKSVRTQNFELSIN